jgi:hypothetical protein
MKKVFCVKNVKLLASLEKNGYLCNGKTVTSSRRALFAVGAINVKKVLKWLKYLHNSIFIIIFESS